MFSRFFLSRSRRATYFGDLSTGPEVDPPMVATAEEDEEEEEMVVVVVAVVARANVLTVCC